MTRPLIFSAPMVAAMLAGAKTMTRRVLKPVRGSTIADMTEETPADHVIKGAKYRSLPFDKLTHPYAVGDRLWVRETWQDYCPAWHGAWCGCGSQEMVASTHRPVYRADPVEDHKRSSPDGRKAPPLRWRSPMFMPRWASRLTLIVESVRVERLQEITEEDAIREGVVAQPGAADGCHFTVNADGMHLQSSTARGAFFRLWKTLHPEHDFDDPTGERNDSEIDANPWVAVIGFRVIRKNIGRIGP